MEKKIIDNIKTKFRDWIVNGILFKTLSGSKFYFKFCTIVKIIKADNFHMETEGYAIRYDITFLEEIYHEDRKCKAK